ncbi:MAG: signal peptidase I [Candidatus Babeliaceae bacterium]|nr:signal peptidase I [Candidatus Babeliaceae bacterium]
MRAISSYFPKSYKRFIDETVSIINALIIIFLIRTFIFGLYQVPSGSMETTLLVGESLVSDKLSIWFTPIKRGEVIAFNQPTYDYSENVLMNVIERYVLGIFWGPQNWTKRVIGIPGDHVQGRIEDGKTVVYINGERLIEPYVNTYPLARQLKVGTWATFNPYNKEDYYNIQPISYDVSKSPEEQPFYKTSWAKLLHKDGKLVLIEPGTPQERGIDVYDIHLKDNEYWCMGDNRLGSSDCREIGIVDGKLIHGRVIFRLFSFDDPENSWMIISFLKNPITFWSKIRWNRCLQWIK